ncbi:MAG TPA: DUF1883 domain-containing protein [Arsenophonus nasoniae]|uniref:DUF1883 domain-containing protein n=1 Tax=Arsenophonus nasoniae TaxID=638 RepID=UPI0038793CDA
MQLNTGDTVVINCTHQCNILMTTDSEFNNYRNGRTFRHHGGGGFFKRLPAQLTVPSNGYWNITLDLVVHIPGRI